MSVESQIVTMIFENTRFAGPVNATLGILDKLKTALNFGKEQQQISQLEQAGGRFNMGGMGTAVDGVSAKFLALSTIAITALSNITTKAISAATSFVKGFTFAPIMDGLREYETNLKSIQTVQANTDRPLPEINAALEELNRYSDMTIYNFGEMAKNVGTFTAAGVDLQTSVSSIKGIANLAALSGSSSEQAATAMYQLSQAISSGRVGLQDWNSVVNAGMGGKKLQNALAQTAIAMGDIDAASVKLEGPMKKLTINGKSFRESIMAKPGEESWLSSDILVNTLSAMDNRFSRAALSQEKLEDGTLRYKNAIEVTAAIEKSRAELEKKNGVKYTDEQFAALMQMSDAASQAATQVKTLGQVFDIAKETIGSGWSASFKSIFGNLTEAKKTFTNFSGSLNDIINANALLRNNTLADWKDDGGRKAVIQGLKNAFEALRRVFRPLTKAFRDLFPRKTGEELANMSKSFRDFTDRLIISKEAMGKLRATFRGVFAIFSIGWQIVKGLAGVFFDLFGAATEGTSGILDITAGIGDWLYGVDQALKKGDGLKNFFSGLTDILRVPIDAIKSLAALLGGAFDGLDSGEVSDKLSPVGDAFGRLESIGNRLKAVWDGISGMFSGIASALAPLGEKIGEAFGGITEKIGDAFANGDYSGVMDALNVGLLGGIVLLIRNFLKNGFSVNLGGEGFLDSIKDGFDSLTGSMKAMQTQIQAKALLLIASAVALLTASMVALSLIDSEDLTKALGAMTAGFGQLLGSFAILSKLSGKAGFAAVPAAATALVALSTAVLILAGAVAIFATMSPEELAKGLSAVTVTLGALVASAQLIGKNAGSILATGVAMIPLAIGLTMIAGAVALFALMSWEDLAKGGAAIGGALAVIAGALFLIPPTAPLQAAGILLVAVAVNVLAGALKIIATASWEDIGKGGAVLAGALIAIGLALALIPPTAPLVAAGIMIVAEAMVVLAGALKIFATMSWEEIGKGMAVLAGSLLILGVALYAMSGTLVGAAALMVAALALAVLTPVLLALSQLGWDELLVALAALAGVFVLLGAAGYLLGPVVIVIIGLGAAMLLLGAGMALIGAGALLLATAFGIFTAAGSAGLVMIGALINYLPQFFAKLGEGVVAFAVAIGKGGPAILQAFEDILSALIGALMRLIPKIGELIGKLIQTILKVITENIGKIVAAGFSILMAILSGIEDNIGKIVDKGARIIVKFLNGVAENIGDVIEAGANLIISTLEGIEATIRKNSQRFIDAGVGIADAIIDGIVQGIKDLGGKALDAIGDLGGSLVDKGKDALGVFGSPAKEFIPLGRSIPDGLISGMKSGEGDVGKAAGSLGNTASGKMSEALGKMAEVMQQDFDLNPTLTPVLDLTKLTQDASRIDGLLALNPIAPTVSYGQASDIYNQQQASSTPDAPSEPTVPGDVKIEQNYYSPRAISAGDSYRATRSAAGLLKGVLESK